MADASYQPKVYRKQGGAFYVVASGGEISVESGGLIVVESGGVMDVESGGQVDVQSGGTIDVESGGTIDFESGGYYTQALVSHSTALSPLIIGAMNKPTSTGTTGMAFLLPTPVAGAEVWFFSTVATTGGYYLCAGTVTTNIDRVIGSSTEAGYGADQNNLMETSGGVIGLKAVNSSMWVVISNVPASICTTVIPTTA